ENYFSNIKNTGTIAFNATQDEIENIINESIITTTGKTEFTTLKNEDGASATVAGETSFVKVINDGEITTDGSTVIAEIKNTGSLKTSGENEITTIENSGSVELFGDDTVGTLTNNGTVLARNDSRFASVINAGNIYTTGTTVFGTINNTGTDDANTALISTDGTTTFNENVNNNAYAVLTLKGNNTFNKKLINKDNGLVNTLDSDLEDIQNLNTFANIENSGNINLNASEDEVLSLINSGVIVTTNKTTFGNITSTGTNSVAATISANGENIFNGQIKNNAYSTITVLGDTIFNDLVTNALNAVIITGDSTVQGVENKTIFENVSNAGELNLNGSNDTVKMLVNTGTVNTQGTTVFENVKNNRNASITTAGTNTFKDIVDEGTITLGGNSTLEGEISGKGSLIVTGTSTLDTTIEKDLNVTVEGSGTFAIKTDAVLNLNNGDTWKGIVRMNEENGSLYYDLTSNGRISATKGNIYIQKGVFTVGLGSSVDNAVNMELSKSTSTIVSGGTMTLGSGDVWLGDVTLTSGTLNINNIESNAKLTATAGNLNILRGDVTLATSSLIDTDVRLNLGGNASLKLTGGTVNIDSKDTYDGNITATSGIINLSGRNRTDSTALTYNKLTIDSLNNSLVNTYIANTEINLKSDNIYNTFNMGNLVVADDSSNKTASSLRLDCDVNNNKVDSIAVGKDAMGTITITEFNIGSYTISRNETKEFTVLYRDAQSDGTYNNNFSVELSQSILSKNNTWTVETYKNLDDNTYTLEDDAFIGTIGYRIIDYGSHSNVKIGILEEYDTLYSVNIYDKADLPRVYNITDSKTVSENLNLGVTGAGKFTLNGATKNAQDSVVEMNNYSAFDLENETEFIVNNLTLQNSALAILSNNENATTTLNNAVLSGNIIAIQNNAGRIDIKNSIISAMSNGNTVINKDDMSIASSTIYSDIQNEGTINVSDVSELYNIYNTNTITLSGSTSLRGEISGNGNLNIRGIATLYSAVSDDTIMNIVMGRELILESDSYLTLDNSDSWSGKITINNENANLILKNLKSNGLFSAIDGNLTLEKSLLNISSSSAIAENVDLNLSTDSEIIIDGGTVSVNDKDKLDGAITLKSGTFSYNDLDKNG
ncbi:MAG: hypothetical protein NC200_08275, partial [Candidatus Gastranaerophilales bacterium]|nr:hypothetical protein [Candidatus Gastranaerophilales bacterium]